MTRHPRRTFVEALLIVATLSVIVGCAVGPRPAASDAVNPGSIASPAPTIDNSPGVVDDTPRDDLHDEHVVPWKSVEVVDDHHLRVRFVAGNPACLGTRAVFRENEQDVAIATVEGILPDAPDACSLVGREATLLIELKTPLHDREIRPLTFDGGIPHS